MARHAEWSEELRQELLAPLEEYEEFLPKGGKRGTEGPMQAFLYIGTEGVMRRLDETVGPGGWGFEVREVQRADYPGVVVHGTLTILGASRSDFGEAAGDGELYKSAMSDALKRTARMFGVGRYAWTSRGTRGVYGNGRWTQPPAYGARERGQALRLAGWTGAVSGTASPQKAFKPLAPEAAPAAAPEAAAEVFDQAVQESESPFVPEAAPGSVRKPPGKSIWSAPRGDADASSPAHPVAADATDACSVCGKALLRGQVAISQHKYGGLFCTQHQPKK